MSTGFEGLSQIGQIAIVVQDVERATTFYRDQLGMRFLFAYPGLAFFDAGGVRLMLSRAEDPKLDHPASILYYKVPNIEVAHEALAAKGIHFERPPHLVARMPDHELWLAELQDSEGNILALMTEKR